MPRGPASAETADSPIPSPRPPQARRRREDTTLQIRKNKREEGLAKRRAFQRDVAPVLAPKPDAGNPAAPERPTVADMPRLLNEIQSQDPAVVVAATRGWRKLLSVEPQPPVDAVLATGVVAVLARLLAHHAMPELQFEAAWALTNVASTDKTQAVVDAGVVPAMVQLMQSPNGDVREQCIWCLGNIAGDSTESRDAVLAAGALEPLIANLQNPATTSLLRNATWSLSNLCRGTPKPDVARLAPAIPVLVGLLRSDDVDTLMDACWALSYLSDGDEARIQCVVDHGAAAALSPLLGHASHKVVTPALRTLGNVVTRAAKESEIPNFKGSYLGRFPLVSADFWTSDHLSERSRSVDAFSGTRARGTLILKRR
jgi:hypothetical protein